MPKAKPSNLPGWAKEPLKFAFHPDEALQRGAFSHPPKVQALKKSIRAGRKPRR
jgi:hypothetical protein